VSYQDLIETSLQIKFQTEKLSRTIKDCDDINTVKQIAMELLKLNEQKIAVIEWLNKQTGKAKDLTKDNSNSSLNTL
tara:strand:- start:89 stop:319 length:231 start_codon:yes stop_codon:yes gene_type:complete